MTCSAIRRSTCTQSRHVEKCADLQQMVAEHAAQVIGAPERVRPGTGAPDDQPLGCQAKERGADRARCDCNVQRQDQQ